MTGAPWVISFAQGGLVLLLQTSLLLAAGLLIGAAAARRGALVQSLVYRMTLAAVLAGAFLSLALSGRTRGVWQVRVPDRVTALPAAAAVPPPKPVVTPAIVGAAAGVQAAAPSGRSEAPAPPPPALAAMLAIVVWAAGAVLLLGRLALCHRHVARLRKSALPADPDARELLDRLARQRGIAPPELLSSNEVRSPFLTGHFRPAILLPSGYRESFDAAALESVLAHELAHLARKDCLWNLHARMLCAVGWVQPLLWVAARRMEEASESACDREVVSGGCSAHAYAACLVQMADRLTPARAESIAGVGVVPFRSSLGRRVQQILDRSAPGWSPLTGRIRGVAAVAGLVLVAAVLFAVSGAPPVLPTASAAVQADAGGPKPVLVGRVVDEAGKPLAGMKVYAKASSAQPFTVNGNEQPERYPFGFAKTDAEGKFSFAALLPGKYWVTMEDESGKLVAAARRADVSGDEAARVPDLVATAGALVQGRVLDQKSGEPLPGLELAVDGPHHPEESLPGSQVRSGLDGRFTIRVAEGKSSLWIGGPVDPAAVLDPEKAPRRAHQVEVAVKSGETAEVTLRADGRIFGASTFVGRAVYEDGRPAAGFRIGAQIHESAYLEQRYEGKPNWGEANTAADGTFAIVGLGDVKYNVALIDDTGEWAAAAAEGIAGKLRQQVRLPDLVLTRGGFVTGVVLHDDTGQPLKGVHVGSYGPHRPRSSAMIISSETDEKGAFRLRVAPGLSYVYIADSRFGIDEKGYDVAVGMAETKQLTFRVRPKPRQGPQ